MRLNRTYVYLVALSPEKHVNWCSKLLFSIYCDNLNTSCRVNKHYFLMLLFKQEYHCLILFFVKSVLQIIYLSEIVLKVRRFSLD